jgi:hypothetical protein
VRERAQGTPSLRTPHCRSTSTGPLILDDLLAGFVLLGVLVGEILDMAG